MKTIILTADKYLWCLRPFMHQWQKYCGLPAMIAGFTPPDFPLLDGFTFHSIGAMVDYPVNKWSDALIKVLHAIPDEQVLIMLEDAWVVQPVKVDLVLWLAALMERNPQITRLDLTTDRMYNKETQPLMSLGQVEFVHTPPPLADYQMSLCASLYNKTQLLKILIPGETPWQFEMQGTQRANDLGAFIVGTKQLPIRHLFALRQTEGGGTKLDLKMTWGIPAHPLSDEDIAELTTLGYLPDVQLP